MLAMPALLWVAAASMVSATAAQEALHDEVDRLIEEANFGVVAPLANDAEFLRRIYLDLTGSIPSSNIARAFLDDPSADKRERLIDRLLNSPQYVRYMTDVLDIMLLERRPEQHVKHEDWRKYLYDSLAQNKPWNQLAREILAADGGDERLRPAAAFYLCRSGEPNLLTRDVGRMFFGMDLQCAQCHNHPLISSYYQTDYYGIYAFLSRGLLFTDKEKKVFYAEKAEGDVSFKSVFTEEQGQTNPRLPAGFEIDEPFFLKGEEYEVAPADNVRPIPKYSRRSKLAELATDGSNQQFNRNAANRWWAHMMGRGLVEPVDLHHVENPPSHPEVLELLAKRFVEMQFDVKALLRELALTRTYQRALDVPASFDNQTTTMQSQLAAMEAELQELAGRLTQTRTAANQVESEAAAAKAAADPIHAELTKANHAVGEARKAAEAAAKALAEAKQQEDAKRGVAQALSEAAGKIGEAAQALPNELELAQIAAKFQTRSEQATHELDAATKAVAEKSSPVQVSTEALNAAIGLVEQVKTQLEAARGKLRELQPQLRATLQQRSTAWRTEQSIKSRLAAGRALLEREQFATTAADRQALLNKANAEWARGRETLAATQAELAQLQQAQATAAKAMEDTAQQLGEVTEQLAAKREIAHLLSAAVASLKTAAEKLPAESDLSNIEQTIRVKAEGQDVEAAKLEVSKAERDQLARTAAATFAAAKQAAEEKSSQAASLKEAAAKLETHAQEVSAQHEAARRALRDADDRLVELWSKHFFAGRLKHLTPEQIGWSVMQATGLLDSLRGEGWAEVDKSLPLDPQNPGDAQRLAERERQLEGFVHEKAKGNLAAFVKLFGHGGGQPQADFFATVDQALFFANGGTVLSWLNPGGNNLAARLSQLPDAAAIAEELYLSVLTRRPSAEETADVSQYVASRADDKPGAFRDLAWALITSAEFRFGH